MKKTFRVIVLVLFVIVLPFIIEIFLQKHFFPFCWIFFENKDWFTFFGSYAGAIAAVILGCISFWQTKKYKEQSEYHKKQMNELLIKPDFYIEIIDDVDFPKNGNILNRSDITNCEKLQNIYLKCYASNNSIVELDVRCVSQNELIFDKNNLVQNVGCLYIEQNSTFYIKTSVFLTGKTTIEFNFKNIYSDEYIKIAHFKCDENNYIEIEKLEMSKMKNT